ncbi:MAG: lysophospholipase [Granulosicoccus sp.]
MAFYTHSLRWVPPAGVSVRKQGVYLLHGTGEHAARYEHLANRLTSAGFIVGAHDHPGHGESDGKRGVIDPAGALVTQAAIQIQQFAAETECAPVVFGHSLGGLAATELVLEHGLPVAGLILSAPAFAVQIRARDKLKVKLIAHMSPTFSVERPYDASRLTHDEQVRRQAEADPLNHGFRSAGLVQWLLKSGARQLGNARDLDVDTLLLIAGGDPVVDSSKTQEFAASAPADRMTVHYYDGFLHEILNETPERSDRAFNDIVNWVCERFLVA